ncbi:MAG: WYL domain-containing protein [Cyanobacteriota bacterium]
MVKSSKNIENVCLTAYRVLAIMLMLKECPHSEAEISEKLKNNVDLPRALSSDSIWLYINTIKALGCQISRPTKNNDFKYSLKEHPFKIKLTSSELKSLLEARKYVASLSDWQISCNYDKFLSTICQYIDENDKKELVKHCKAKQREIDYTLKKDLINDLEYHCEQENCLIVNYISLAGNIKEITMLAEKIKYENGALYLWGFNAGTEENQYLRVDRIDSIKKADIEGVEFNKTTIKVIFKLYGICAVSYQPEEDETIIERTSDSITIKHAMKNKFKLIQKILSYGINCEVISPQDIQKEIVKKLKFMSKIYENEI